MSQETLISALPDKQRVFTTQLAFISELVAFPETVDDLGIEPRTFRKSNERSP